MTHFHIDDISLNLSNYCLGRCRYCQLHNPKFWKLENEMTLEDLDNLFHDPMLQHLKTIHITGGEPFLSPKILGLVDIIAETHPDVPVNSPISGLYPYLTYNLAERIQKKLPQYRYNVALEGPNREIHEKIRGKETWNPLWETLFFLKEKLDCNVRVNMTVYSENYKYIVDTHDLAEYSDLELYINFGRFSKRFGNVKDGFMGIPKSSRKEIVQQIEDQLNEIGWINKRPLNTQKWILQKAGWLGQKVKWTCLMGERSIDVDPYGDVWCCLMNPEIGWLGNIKRINIKGEKVSLTSILNRKHTTDILEEIRNGECQPCSFTCSLKIKDYEIDGRKYMGVNV